MNKDEIRYLVLSDIHLGNKRNKTKEIITNIDKYFDHYTNKSIFTDMDVIFIAGDLFDALLDFSSEDIHEIVFWLDRMFSFCSRNNIMFRILEGTPSHDWKQSKIAASMHAMSERDVDFKYIDTLYIERMDKLGITVLYVPDEYTDDTEVTFSHVKKLLSENNLEQVDIAIMHGMFDYQAKWLM